LTHPVRQRTINDLASFAARNDPKIMLRDRLQARLQQMGNSPDYVRIAEDVLKIRNASPALARRLVSQALVIEDRRDAWKKVGARLCAAAPARPGVYVLRSGPTPIYVGKANDVKRRLRTHFAAKRWQAMPPDFAAVTDAEWIEVGCELEALLREAELIRTLQPRVNTQVGPPSMKTRKVAARLVRDLVVILPSVDAESVALVAARAAGHALVLRARRDESDLPSNVDAIWTFFRDQQAGHAAHAPIVFSWLAGRGANATRIEMGDLHSGEELSDRLAAALRSSQLFRERLVLR
jgi:predicted GIY-YIG superfamily endonuclease